MASLIGEQIYVIGHDCLTNAFQSHLRPTFGAAVEEILVAARESKADLIVMGAKARKSLAGHAPLTIAYNVVSKAPCPVLTVRG